MVNNYKIDDQLTANPCIQYDVFIFGDVFRHETLSEAAHTITCDGHTIVLREKDVWVDEQRYTQPMYLSNVGKIKIVIRPELFVQTVKLPRQPFTISNLLGASIEILAEAQVVVAPQMNAQQEVDYYTVYAVSDVTDIYWNDQLVNQIEHNFFVGDRFIVGDLIIEFRPEQLKILSLGNKITFNPWVLTAEKEKSEYPTGFPNYRRSPRIILEKPKDKVPIASPSMKPELGREELMRSILPPAAMIVASILVSYFTNRNPIFMISMASVTVLMIAFSISSYVTNKREHKRKVIEREDNYQHYLIKKSSDVRKLATAQREALLYHYPAMEDLAQMMASYDARLYEKVKNNKDFLMISLGLGDVEASYNVELSHDEIQVDPLVLEAQKNVVEPYKVLKDAPVEIALNEQTLGLSGHYEALKTAVSTMLLQIAAFHSYRDVEFIALVPEESYSEDWKHWRWLPHFEMNSLNLRGIIHNAQTRDMVLTSFYQLLNTRRQAVKEAKNEKVSFSPHYVVTILEDSWLAGHGLNEFLAEDMTQYGVTVIWGKETPAMLPETVTTLIDYENTEAATVINENEVFVDKEFKPYSLPGQVALEQAIQALSNLQHIEVEKNAIPEAITFLDMYQVSGVEQLNVGSRWDKANTAKSLSVPLGLRGKNDLVHLNLHERAHGPHGLVAGTTGSGKSEIVQSYILSLAVNFAPEDVGFLPIDFKGGGMANLFNQLPHLLGSITNLDGASSARALASIRAELQKRQRYFGQYGVNHINGYTKLYKQGKTIIDPAEKASYPTKPLPHLFLISDEFAELKANEPEFMAELVSTARIGRSLGVHLILATQKPSGVVDDQIWSNSRFKLALKVQDASDSNEILKTPDAASITQPGRAYLQVGNNEIYELFQSAWSGASYTPDMIIEEKADERIWLINDLGQYELLSDDLSNMDEVAIKEEESLTQLDAVVQHIEAVAQARQSILPDRPWLPPLEKEILTPMTNYQLAWKQPTAMAVPFALMDLPAEQDQRPFMFDLTKLSHTAIYGSAGFGKSTALQTLVMNLCRQNNPEQLHINLFDFGTNGLLPLRDLPHVADIVRLEEEEKLIKFLKRLRSEVAVRKDLFSRFGVSSLKQYEAKSNLHLPISVTIFDGYDVVRESDLEESIERVINQLLREGASVGMYVILTGLRVDTLKISMTSNIPTRIGLFLVEDGAIRDIVGREALIPQDIIGRAQIKLEEVVSLQVYLPAEGLNDIERLKRMDEEIQELTTAWTGKRPRKIPMVPKTVDSKSYYTNPDVQHYLSKGYIPFGLNQDTTEVIGFRPEVDGYFVVANEQPTQADFVEKHVLKALQHLQGRYHRIVFDDSDRFATMTTSFDTIVPQSDFSSYMISMISEIDERLLNPENEAEKILVFIPDVARFSDKSLIYDDQVVKLLRKGPQVGIHCLFQSEKSKLENSYDDLNKALRNSPPAGLVGSRLTDQELINVKSNYSEPAVGFDQSHYFADRQAVKIKLVSEWLDES